MLFFHSQETKRIIPLRRCSIISVENLGPLVFLRFRVGDFIQLESAIPGSIDPQPRAGAADELSKTALDFVGNLGGSASLDLSQSLPEGAYFRPAKASCSAFSWITESGVRELASAWASLITILQNEPNLMGIPMFYLLGFQQEDGEFVSPRSIKNRFSDTRQPIQGFRLVERDRYRLRILQWHEPPQKEPSKLSPEPALAPDYQPVRVNCTVNQDSLLLEGASNLVVGRYDVLELTFLARRHGYSELTLRAEPLITESETPDRGKVDQRVDPVPQPATAKDGGTAPEYQASAAGKPPQQVPWPAIYAVRVPIHVRHNLGRLLLLSLIGIAGIGLFHLSGPLGSPYSQAAQLIGLSMVLLTIGDYLERFVKVREGANQIIGRTEEKTGTRNP